MKVIFILMNADKIKLYNEFLFFVRSFEGITHDNCSNLESLRDGYTFVNIYNQMTNPPNMFDTSLLRSSKETGDWVPPLFNLCKLYRHIEPEFRSLNIFTHIDLYKIANKGDLDQICAFIKMLFYYLLKCPKKEELKPVFQSLPTRTKIVLIGGIKTNQS